MQFILFGLFVVSLLLFPYRRVWHWLNQLLDAKLFMTGLLLIAFRFICIAVIPEIGDSPSPPPAESTSYTESLSLMTGAFARALSWIMVITGVIMILYALWQSKEHRQEMQKKSKH